MTTSSQSHGEADCLYEHGDNPSQANGTIPQPTSQTVENTSSSGGHPKPQKTFSDLPAELRNMIWQAALVPRIVMIYPRDRATETEPLNQVDFNKIPGMLFANQESRRIALHHYNQRFTLAFTKGLSTKGLMCRIPVIMSTDDALAFCTFQLSPLMAHGDAISISVDAADGAPAPWIKRFSLLGDSLMRQDINEEHLARLLDPGDHVWDYTEITCRDCPWTIDWSPFSGKQPEPGTFGPFAESVESVRIKFRRVHGSLRLDDWLRSSFNSWYYLSLNVMDRDWVDACVVELPEPMPPHLVWGNHLF